MTTPLISALAIGWPGQLPIVAQHLELSGYARLWITEHHALDQSASPLLAAAITATATRRLHVGTAGVMLRYVSPLRLAKDVHFLDAMFPGRVDVGVIGGFASPKAADAVLAPPNCRTDASDDAIDALLRFLWTPETTFDDGEPTNILRRTAGRPLAWICSNRESRAAFAARRGMGLIFHIPQAGEGGVGLALRAAETYRREFVPSTALETPRFAIVVAGICAESHAAALRQWPLVAAASDAQLPIHQLTTPAAENPPSHFFLGAPGDCRRHILELADLTGTSEVIVHCASDSAGGTLRGFGLLAEAFGLPGRAA